MTYHQVPIRPDSHPLTLNLESPPRGCQNFRDFVARLVGIHTDSPDRVVYGQHEEFVQLILQRYNVGLIRPSLLTGCKVSG
jgi:hypothetical protein